MTETIVVLTGWSYVAILSILGLVGISLVLQGILLAKLVKYTQMNGMDIGSVDFRLRTLFGNMTKADLTRYQAITTRFIYLKGQLDRLLNGQVSTKSEILHLNGRYQFLQHDLVRIAKVLRVLKDRSEKVATPEEKKIVGNAKRRVRRMIKKLG